MKSFLAAVAVTLLATACASAPDTTADTAPEAPKAVNCRNADAPTGSHLKRRADCEAASSDKSADARRDTEQLQELQRQTTNLRLHGQ